MCLWLLLKHVQNFMTEIWIVLTVSHYSHICIKGIWKMDSLCTLYLKLLGLIDIQKFHWKNKYWKWKQRCSCQEGSLILRFISKGYFKLVFINYKLITSLWTMFVTWHLFFQVLKWYKHHLMWNELLWVL